MDRTRPQPRQTDSACRNLAHRRIVLHKKLVWCMHLIFVGMEIGYSAKRNWDTIIILAR